MLNRVEQGVFLGAPPTPGKALKGSVCGCLFAQMQMLQIDGFPVHLGSETLAMMNTSLGIFSQAFILLALAPLGSHGLI